VRVWRFRCTACGKTFTRLPSFLLPFKHYVVKEIEGVMRHLCDGGKLSQAPSAAEESTLRRWWKEYSVKMQEWAGLLESRICEPSCNHPSLRMDAYSAMSLILVGQTELRETLKLQVNKAIWQRVDMRFHLQALPREETAAYIAKHLATVKMPGEIFSHAAVGVINEYCEGIPRQVNKVAIACLMAAAGQNQKLIDDHLVRIVIESEFEA